MSATEPEFVDTNILVYAYNTRDGQRHTIARKLILECFEGKRVLVVSNQVLAEFIRVVRFKLEIPFPQEMVQQIIQDINKFSAWKKINYTTNTLEHIPASVNKTIYWDQLLVETMKENGIVTIYTENVKDFQNIHGINAINPFKPV